MMYDSLVSFGTALFCHCHCPAVILPLNSSSPRRHTELTSGSFRPFLHFAFLNHHPGTSASSGVFFCKKKRSLTRPGLQNKTAKGHRGVAVENAEASALSRSSSTFLPLWTLRFKKESSAAIHAECQVHGCCGVKRRLIVHELQQLINKITLACLGKKKKKTASAHDVRC